MDSLGRSAQELTMLLKPMVAMFVQQIHPLQDELSMSRAYEDYGRKWIEAQREAGNLNVRYKGNRKIVSKAEIECLKAAESAPATIILK